MTDILDLIDNATEQRCACGCCAPLDPDGPSAWFASQECQRRWGDAQATDPQDVYSRPDAGHEPPARPGRAGPTCRNCGNPIQRQERSSTGWTHGVEQGDWEGVRCPGRITGAVPVERIVSTAPEWLVRLFPDVDDWERRGAMWRTQSGGPLVRDSWLYVLGEDYVHASAIVTAEFLDTAIGDVEQVIEQDLRDGIETGLARMAALDGCDCSGGRDLHEGQCLIWATLRQQS